MNKKMTAPDVLARKGGRKLTMLTAYDYPMAQVVDKSGVDMILVGDSLAMVVLGHEDTLSVTMDEMLHHTRAVSRGAGRALVVGDMPFGSYHESAEQSVKNAVRFMKEGGARAIKLEGAQHIEHVRAIVKAEVPVMGHIGLTPQSVAAMGGFKVQGKTAEAAKRLMEQADMLVDAGCFSLVLECVPAPVAEEISRRIPIPTIGIGAGAGCDGQVLVFHDALGMFDRFTPKFVKKFANLSEQMVGALETYRKEVEEGVFPDAAHTFAISEDELSKLY